MPLMDYESVTRSGKSATNLEHILKLQKCVAYIILHANYITQSQTMFQELE